MKQIPIYPDYYITEDGKHVYSMRRGGLKEKKIQMGAYGYRLIGLRKPQDSKAYTIKVSILVALTFIPNPNNYPFVLHLDNIRDNDGVENLAWGDHEINMAQMKREGRGKGNTYVGKGRKGNVKYKIQDHKKVFKLRQEGGTVESIGALLNIPRTCVGRILKKNVYNF